MSVNGSNRQRVLYMIQVGSVKSKRTGTSAGPRFPTFSLVQGEVMWSYFAAVWGTNYQLATHSPVGNPQNIP